MKNARRKWWRLGLALIGLSAMSMFASLLDGYLPCIGLYPTVGQIQSINFVLCVIWTVSFWAGMCILLIINAAALKAYLK
jgi:hypothetical protein